MSRHFLALRLLLLFLAATFIFVPNSSVAAAARPLNIACEALDPTPAGAHPYLNFVLSPEDVARSKEIPQWLADRANREKYLQAKDSIRRDANEELFNDPYSETIVSKKDFYANRPPKRLSADTLKLDEIQNAIFLLAHLNGSYQNLKNDSIQFIFKPSARRDREPIPYQLERLMNMREYADVLEDRALSLYSTLLITRMSEQLAKNFISHEVKVELSHAGSNGISFPRLIIEILPTENSHYYNKVLGRLFSKYGLRVKYDPATLIRSGSTASYDRDSIDESGQLASPTIFLDNISIARGKTGSSFQHEFEHFHGEIARFIFNLPSHPLEGSYTSNKTIKGFTSLANKIYGKYVSLDETHTFQRNLLRLLRNFDTSKINKLLLISFIGREVAAKTFLIESLLARLFTEADFKITPPKDIVALSSQGGDLLSLPLSNAESNWKDANGNSAKINFEVLDGRNIQFKITIFTHDSQTIVADYTLSAPEHILNGKIKIYSAHSLLQSHIQNAKRVHQDMFHLFNFAYVFGLKIQKEAHLGHSVPSGVMESFRNKLVYPFLRDGPNDSPVRLPTLVESFNRDVHAREAKTQMGPR